MFVIRERLYAHPVDSLIFNQATDLDVPAAFPRKTAPVPTKYETQRLPGPVWSLV